MGTVTLMSVKRGDGEGGVRGSLAYRMHPNPLPRGKTLGQGQLEVTEQGQCRKEGSRAVSTDSKERQPQDVSGGKKTG